MEREIVTSSNVDVNNSISLMANTKQMAPKANNGQGTPVRFPHGDKPGGKAAKHMKAASKDNNNNGSDSCSSSDNEQSDNQVQGTIRAGRQCRVWGGKARIYK